MRSLPIDALLPEIQQSLADSPNLVLQAAPGAGKTTRVPLALLQGAWLAGRKIILLEPRRLAARAAARFMAASLGEPVGETVGYRVRLDKRVGPRTRIEVVTEGMLSRLLQDDPSLEGIGLVIFDEFHERSLPADLGLALCLDSQSALRDDLRLLVMSATLDGAAVAALMGGAPLLSSEGRSYPVEIRYRPTRSDYARQRHAFCEEVAALARRVAESEPGSLLVFLPGAAEIRQVHGALQAAGLPGDVLLAPLYGRLDPHEQDAAIRPAAAGRRKIVLATSIAETSLTIEGIRIVIDAGLARQLRFDPNTGLDRLVTLPVSRAAAEQRAGRAGRLEAGICYRLWSEHRHLVAQSLPELLQADLAPLVLELANWGVADCTKLRWLDAPPAAHVAQAQDLLLRLQALDPRGRITAHGRQLARLGVHPRLAHMMLRGRDLGYGRLACELAALLSEADPLGGADSDIQSRVEWLRGALAERGVQRAKRTQLRTLAAQWCAQLGVAPAQDDATDLALCGALLAYAYPDRIGQRRGGQDARFVLSNGRGARFRRAEPLAAEDLVVAAHLDGEREASIFLAAALRVEHLYEFHADLIKAASFIAWDDKAQCVQARLQQRLGELLLADQPLHDADSAAVQHAMLEGIQRHGLACLPWNEETRRLQARVNFLHSLDTAHWPDFSDSFLLHSSEQWLLPFLNGVTRLAQLKRVDLRAALLAMLDWQQQQQLDTLAPSHIRVPSGSSLRVDYSAPTPVLAVRLQEMFGLAETPRVAGGAVPVVLHLLSPAQRPVQVTQDLAAFWAGSYREVKKELQGRYPKHYWPDDPMQARATARARPRK
ncbi:MAG: ATP-dependent helicase HrpB [Thiogranum sp.]